MKKLVAAALVVIALVAFPVVLHARAPEDVPYQITDIVFDPVDIQVEPTKAGLRVTAVEMRGTGTIQCDVPVCALLDGEKVVIRQAMRIEIDHVSAGLKANGAARGTLDLPGLSNSAKLVAKVSGTRVAEGTGFSIHLTEVCKMSAYLNDRIRELNKFRMELDGQIVRDGDRHVLVNLRGHAQGGLY